MKFRLIFLSLFLLAGGVRSQNTGYGGKRVVLKGELLHGTVNIMSGVSAEVVLNRKITASAGIRWLNSRYSQRYMADDYADKYSTCSDVPLLDSDDRIKDKADIKSASKFLEFRYYLSDLTGQPAPAGLFCYLGGGFGKADVSGSYFRSLMESLEYDDGNYLTYPDCFPDYLISYSYQGVKTRFYELGAGYQHFLTPWLTLDAKAALNLTNLNYDEQFSKTITTGVSRTYGPNLVRFHLLEWSGPSTKSIGMSGSVQLGIMLF